MYADIQRQKTNALLYNKDAFSRLDEQNDAEFYSRERFVHHLDSQARQTIEHIISSLVIEPHPRILDLMASWNSHIPHSLKPAELAGLGLNQKELETNASLTQRVIHDLNAHPTLPFEDEHFNVVLNTVSVDYMTRPFEVFAEVGRILKPGGLFLVTFSNRMFPEKAVKIWREGGSQERILYVEDFFAASGSFSKTHTFISQGKPRPKGDKYEGLGLPSDPVFAVYAEKRTTDTSRKPRPPIAEEDTRPYSQDEVERRKAHTHQTLECPYCQQRMKKWQIPVTPFTEWDVEFMYVCFNDTCPFLSRGYSTMNRQGIMGYSHRNVYIRERDQFISMPITSLKALREHIIE